MEDVLPLLIPIIGVSIPLVVVAGKFIVQPILQVLNKRTELQAAARDVEPLARRLEATEERLAMLEKSLDRVLEEQEFQGKLLSGHSGPTERSYLRRGGG
jgi:hypothetical protein